MTCPQKLDTSFKAGVASPKVTLALSLGDTPAEIWIAPRQTQHKRHSNIYTNLNSSHFIQIFWSCRTYQWMNLSCKLPHIAIKSPWPRRRVVISFVALCFTRNDLDEPSEKEPMTKCLESFASRFWLKWRGSSSAWNPSFEFLKLWNSKCSWKIGANVPIGIEVHVDATGPFGLLQNTTDWHQLLHDIMQDFGDGHSTRRKPRVFVATTIWEKNGFQRTKSWCCMQVHTSPSFRLRRRHKHVCLGQPSRPIIKNNFPVAS